MCRALTIDRKVFRLVDPVELERIFSSINQGSIVAGRAVHHQWGAPLRLPVSKRPVIHENHGPETGGDDG